MGLSEFFGAIGLIQYPLDSRRFFRTKVSLESNEAEALVVIRFFRQVSPKQHSISRYVSDGVSKEESML